MKKEIVIDIDIEKENPLVTILKAGKIPVIRRSEDGFRNYDQTDYFKHHEIEGPVFNGCFCLLVGIYGNFTTEWHIYDPLNIGYIEPDAKVFSTYRDREEDFAVTTAKERYDNAVNIHKNMIIPNYGTNHNFELYEEAIVKAEDITPVCSFPLEEYYKLVKYSKDNLNTIFNKDTFLENVLLFDCLPIEFMNKFNINNFEEFIELFNYKEERYYGITECNEFIINHNIIRNLMFNEIYKFVVDEDTSEATCIIDIMNEIKKKGLKYIEDKDIEITAKKIEDKKNKEIEDKNLVKFIQNLTEALVKGNINMSVSARTVNKFKQFEGLITKSEMINAAFGCILCPEDAIYLQPYLQDCGEWSAAYNEFLKEKY